MSCGLVIAEERPASIAHSVMSDKSIKKRARPTRDEQEQEQFEKKQRKPRDAAAPKRPPTSYVLFCKSHHDEAMREARAIEPKPTVRTISAVLSAKWKVVSPAEKEEYERQSLELREKYYADKKEYDKMKAEQQQKQQIEDASTEEWEADAATRAPAPTGGEDKVSSRRTATAGASKQKGASAGAAKGKAAKKVKKDKDKAQPKRPIPAYIYFCNENRNRAREALEEGSNAKLVLTKLGAMWQELTPEQRVPYDDMAKADRQRYEDDLTRYRAAKADSDDEARA